MKRLWMLAMSVALAIASGPDTGWAQQKPFQIQRGNETITVEKVCNLAPLRTVAVGEDKRIYIGGNISAPAPRIRVSADNGQTWLPESGNTDPYGDVSAFAFIDSGYVLAGTDYGIYRSKDRGMSWQRVFQPKPYLRVLALLVTQNKLIFAGADDAVFHSTDNGNTWLRVADSTVIWPYARTLTQTARNGVILAGSQSGLDAGKGVARSTDNGQTWHLSNTGLPVEDGKIANIRAIAGYPSGFSPNVYLVTEFRGAFWSNDEGLSWQPVPIPNRWGGAAHVNSPLGVFLGFVFFRHQRLRALPFLWF